MNSTTTNSTIKTSNWKLNMKNVVTTKYLIYSQKKSALESSKHFQKYMKSASSKQNNVAKICQERQNKGKPYIFTHDPKFINLFDI